MDPGILYAIIIIVKVTFLAGLLVVLRHRRKNKISIYKVLFNQKLGPSVSYVRNQVTFYSLVFRKEIQKPKRLMGPRYSVSPWTHQFLSILTVLPLLISA